MTEPGDKPKIIIDSDWKAEAEKEKERLAQEVETEKAHAPLGQPTFLHLVNMLAMQATIALGGMRGPQGETIPPDPELARFHIDMLGVIEEKTKGNLNEEETRTLGAVLHELRTMFVQLAQLAARQPKA